MFIPSTLYQYCLPWTNVWVFLLVLSIRYPYRSLTETDGNNNVKRLATTFTFHYNQSIVHQKWDSVVESVRYFVSYFVVVRLDRSKQTLKLSLCGRVQLSKVLNQVDLTRLNDVPVAYNPYVKCLQKCSTDE